MRCPHTLTARVRQDILLVIADTIRSWFYGDDMVIAAVRDKIDAILEDAFAAHSNRIINDIRIDD